jgi:leucyl-tRNA synthetase
VSTWLELCCRFLDYGDEAWKEEVKSHVKDMELYSDDVRKNFNASLDWLHEHACSRSYGLGVCLVIVSR